MASKQGFLFVLILQIADWYLACDSSDACSTEAPRCAKYGSLLQKSVHPVLESIRIDETDNMDGGMKLQRLLDALWNGHDIFEESLDLLMQKQWVGNAPSSALDLDQSGSPVRYTVLGAFDSGTSLFSALVKLNLPQIRWQRGSVWKHSTIGAEAITQAYAERMPLNETLQELVVVILVRSPISQISSWKKAPYHLQNCLDRPYTAMGESCVGYTESIDPDYDDGYKPHAFKSSMDAYNTYLAQYQELKVSGKFKQVLMVSYEDLVLDPAKVMADFAAGCSISLPKHMSVVDDRAKEHGNAIGREAALQKIASRSWLSDVGPSGLGVLCLDLNISLIEGIVEGSYRMPENQIRYSQDCLNPEVGVSEHG